MEATPSPTKSTVCNTLDEAVHKIPFLARPFHLQAASLNIVLSIACLMTSDLSALRYSCLQLSVDCCCTVLLCVFPFERINDQNVYGITSSLTIPDLSCCAWKECALRDIPSHYDTLPIPSSSQPLLLLLPLKSPNHNPNIHTPPLSLRPTLRPSHILKVQILKQNTSQRARKDTDFQIMFVRKTQSPFRHCSPSPMPQVLWMCSDVL